MSSTNRGAVRRINDSYMTPLWLIEAVVPHLARRLATVPQPRILEPAAGDGSIVRILEAAFPKARIDSGDLTTGRDFLTHRYKRDYYHLIISNSPYKFAREFVDRAFDLRPLITVMLLRINFLGSQGRAAWWREGHTGNLSLYVSPRRPSFTGTKTDSCEYAWFVWGPGRPEIVHLSTENFGE